MKASKTIAEYPLISLNRLRKYDGIITVVRSDGTYYIGKLHRADGPAIIITGSFPMWHEEGKRIYPMSRWYKNS